MALELSGRGDYGFRPLHNDDTPNADGFYEITGIKGETNGVAITGLHQPGTSIPGNDGYPVDNLVKSEAPQLSLHGFGYALADGTYANPFYGAHFVPPGVFAFFSDPKNRQAERTADEVQRGEPRSVVARLVGG